MNNRSPAGRWIAASLLAAAAAAPAAVGVDGSKSSVTARFTQMKVPVEGRFTAINGAVQFVPGKPETSTARLDIATASFDIGDAEYNAEVRKPEWLDAKNHPTASFVSTAFASLGANRYQATGTLSFKGRSQSLTVPVTVLGGPTATVFDGSFALSRKAFAVGDASWDSVLADPVQVNFHIVQPK